LVVVALICCVDAQVVNSEVSIAVIDAPWMGLVSLLEICLSSGDSAIAHPVTLIVVPEELNGFIRGVFEVEIHALSAID